MTITRNTATALLDAAQDLVQTRGFNAFSFRDLANLVGVRTASIHYHFPTKVDLGERLMQRYQLDLERRLERIASESDSARERLARFVDSYREKATTGTSICMCGSLASDVSTLPDTLRESIERFFNTTRSWLQEVIEEGVAKNEFQPKNSPAALAATWVAALQGSLQMARVSGDVELIDGAENVLIRSLEI